MLQKHIDYNFCIYDVCNDVLLNNYFYYLKNEYMYVQSNIL